MNIDNPSMADVPLLRSLWCEAFGDTDAALNDFFLRAFSSRRCLCVKDGEALIGAMYWFDCEYNGKKVAYIYAVATKCEYRGRGVCASLMARAHELLAEQGYAMAILSPASEGLFGFYERLGYIDCTAISESVIEASGRSVSLRRIGSEEYGCLRKALLPDGSVIQEGENLAFLETYAELYAGDGVLLAIQQTDGEEDLRIIEILGRTLGGDIASSFGCKRAFVRAFGNGKRFTMCKLFDNTVGKPKYFGLIFD